MCPLAPLWQFKLNSVTMLTHCARGLSLPADGTEIHPTLAAGPWAAIVWSWLSFPQPEPRVSQGKRARPCRLAFTCQKAAERGARGSVLAALPLPCTASPWSCPNPTVAAAVCGSKCLAEVPLQRHGESELGNWTKLAERPLCGPFFVL